MAIANLRNIKKVLELINERRANVASADDFLHSPDGMMRLDAICMNLIAIGEATKNLDKITKGELFPSYPEMLPVINRMLNDLEDFPYKL